MDKLWDSFEEKIPDDNFLVDEELSCDVCSKVLSCSGNEKWRMLNYMEVHYDFCFDCYDKLCEYPLCGDEAAIKFKIIDRTNYSIYENPRIWPCYFCKEKQGGGCKWYNFKEIDVCSKCYTKKLNFNALIFDPTNKNLKLVMRNDTPCIIDLQDIYESPLCGDECGEATLIPNRRVPKELENEVLSCRMSHYAGCLGSCIYLDPNFGPVKEWAMFTDLYNDFPGLDVDTALLVNCSGDKKRNGMIASLCMDDHGRTSFDIIYNNLDDYLKALREWQKNRITNQQKFKQMRESVLNKLEEKYSIEDGSMDEEEYAQILTEFSGYIRIVKKLEINFG